MTKITCKSAKQDGSPCKGLGLGQFDGYCIAHGLADQTREWRVRGGKASATPATASRADKRIPERLQGVINALTEGMTAVREGTLSPAAFKAMCRGAEIMVDLDRHAAKYGWPQLLDHEMGKIRCVQTDAVGSGQSTKCSSAGVR